MTAGNSLKGVICRDFATYALNDYYTQGSLIMLLEKFFDAHYRLRRLFGKSQETVRLYRFSIRSFGKTLGKKPTLKDLTSENVVMHMQRVIDDGRSPMTANKDRAQILALWRFAFRLKMVSEWPDVPELKEPQRVPEAWLASEIQALLAAARKMTGEFCGVPRSIWWETMILVCLDTGERIGAVRPAKWAWFQEPWITMPAEVRKGKRRDKCYKLSAGTCAKLAELRKWSGGGEDVFPFPYCHHYFWPLYGKVLEAAGLPNGRKHKAHKLRKTTASVIFAAGLDAQSALDHSSKKITEGYLDPRYRKADQPCDILEDFLKNPKPPQAPPNEKDAG